VGFARIADFLNKQGWLAAVPRRRGSGNPIGSMKKSVTATDRALRGADRALTDMDAAIAVLGRRQDIAAVPVLIGGQSRGGVLSIAYVGMHPKQTLGVLNFVGRWFSEKVSRRRINQSSTLRAWRAL